MPAGSLPSYSYIDSDSALDQVLKRVESVDRVAIDTEANSLHRYFERVCLIQLTLDDEHFIVDPLAEIDINKLLDAIAQKRLIFHAADYDLRIMRASFDFQPQNDVFDTMIAAQLLGREELGLAALVLAHFDFTLSKRGQKSDWTRRPLTDGQLAYAVHDTRFLLQLAEELEGELSRLGRSHWHRQSCDRMIQGALKEQEPDPDTVWRIRGLGGCSLRELALVRELWHWRDGEARKADRPPFKILGNQQLVDLAKWAAANDNGSFSHAPGSPRHLNTAQQRRLDRAVCKARDLSESQWPTLRKRKGPPSPRLDIKPVLETLRVERDRIADELKVPPAVIAPRAALEAIARTRPETPDEMVNATSLLPWQAELLESAVSRAIQSG